MKLSLGGKRFVQTFEGVIHAADRGQVIVRKVALISCICASLLAFPATAPAKGGPVDKLAASTCAKERKAIGRKAFSKKYGERRSMQTCIRRTRGKVRGAQRQAAQDCAEELAELGPAEFAEDYGSDETGTDAMANCIAETIEWLLEPEDDSGDEGEEEEV
jgi:hypothetical protein